MGTDQIGGTVKEEVNRILQKVYETGECPIDLNDFPVAEELITRMQRIATENPDGTTSLTDRYMDRKTMDILRIDWTGEGWFLRFHQGAASYMKKKVIID